jgi:hypothetical protein
VSLQDYFGQEIRKETAVPCPYKIILAQKLGDGSAVSLQDYFGVGTLQEPSPTRLISTSPSIVPSLEAAAVSASPYFEFDGLVRGTN